MVPPPEDKWAPLIRQINDTEDTGQKTNLLGTMLQMIATNDLVCLEVGQKALNRKFDSCMKRVYAIGIAIMLLLFTGIEAKTIWGIVKGIVTLVK